MSTRIAILAIAVAGAAAGAAWWVLRDGDPPGANPDAATGAASATPRRAVPPLPSEAAPEGVPAKLPAIAFTEQLPVAYRPDAVKAAVADFGDWLAAKYPSADAKFLGADCSTPPCMIGLSFSSAGLSDARDLRGFYADARAELERRVGWRMTTVHADEDERGRQYVWMYGISGDADAALTRELRENAERRHAARLDPIRPPIEPAIPGPGEPGYD